MVFLQGTAIMHSAALKVDRRERLRQVLDRDPSVREWDTYIPAEGVVEKLRCWSAQGAEFVYLSSHRKPENVAVDEVVVKAHGFPAGRILSRSLRRTYGELIGRERPDVLIEDDCESIGAAEIAHAQIPAWARDEIRLVVVPEMGGFADLPDSLTELWAVATRRNGQ